MPWLLVGLLLAAVGGLLYWRHRRRTRHRLISLVALLREPVTFDSAILARLAGKAWKADLGDGGEEGTDGFVVCTDIISTIMCKGRMYLINTFARPYVDDRDKAAEEFIDQRLAELWCQHEAWFSVDAMGITHATPEDEILAEYRRIGRLMAELIDDNVLLLYAPDNQCSYAINDETVLALRSKNPLERLQDTLTVPIVNVADDDPEMLAAVESARDSWPRFVEAYEAQRGESFAIKAPITRGDNTEFIWITVTAIEGDRIYGELANEPANLGKLREGSKVSVPLKELNDWMFIDAGGNFEGGFTVKVIEKAAQRAARKRR